VTTNIRQMPGIANSPLNLSQQVRATQKTG